MKRSKAYGEKAAKIDKGSQRPHLDKVGKLNRAQLEEIAKTKMKDLNAIDLDGARLDARRVQARVRLRHREAGALAPGDELLEDLLLLGGLLLGRQIDEAIHERGFPWHDCKRSLAGQPVAR